MTTHTIRTIDTFNGVPYRIVLGVQDTPNKPLTVTARAGKVIMGNLVIHSSEDFYKRYYEITRPKRVTKAFLTKIAKGAVSDEEVLKDFYEFYSNLT